VRFANTAPRLGMRRGNIVTLLLDYAADGCSHEAAMEGLIAARMELTRRMEENGQLTARTAVRLAELSPHTPWCR
jgi:hypothetical protein